MKLMIVVLLTVLVAGCCTTPQKPVLVEAPSELLIPCPELLQVESDSPVEFVKVVVENYTTYHECSTKLSGWLDWYTTQRKAINSVK